jgi:hypothetical protein
MQERLHTRTHAYLHMHMHSRARHQLLTLFIPICAQSQMAGNLADLRMHTQDQNWSSSCSRTRSTCQAVKSDPTKFSGKKSKAAAKKGPGATQWQILRQSGIPEEDIPAFRWGLRAALISAPLPCPAFWGHLAGLFQGRCIMFAQGGFVAAGQSVSRDPQWGTDRLKVETLREQRALYWRRRPLTTGAAQFSGHDIRGCAYTRKVVGCALIGSDRRSC